MTDFSKTLIYCSSLGYMMGNSEVRKLKKYENLCKELELEKAKYESMDSRRREMQSGLDKAEKIKDLEQKVAEAFATKDELVLSAGFKTFLKKFYAFVKYNKWSVAEEKPIPYTTKGKLVEQLSIDMINRVHNLTIRKNEECFSNEFIQGIPDCIDDANDTVVEIKNSWDAVSFFDLIDKDLDADYWWQMQGYLALTGANKGQLSYCLVSTPDTLIQDKIDVLMSKMNPTTSKEIEDFAQRGELIEKSLTFDDIPENERVITFHIARNDEAIAKAYEKVGLCRKYLHDIERFHLNPTLWQRDISPISA